MPNIRDKGIYRIERRVYRMTFAELRELIQEAVAFAWWPGDGQVMIDLLFRYKACFIRNDQNRLITVKFSHGHWTHKDALTATFKAFAYHALVYDYYKEIENGKSKTK